jgi:hypothetical protein
MEDPSMNNETLDLFASIQEKQETVRELSRQLEKSMTIEQIWPEAFTTGMPVRLKGKQSMFPGTSRKVGFTVAYFECRDGRKYYLSREELMQFKPDAIVHPDY